MGVTVKKAIFSGRSLQGLELRCDCDGQTESLSYILNCLLEIPLKLICTHESVQNLVFPMHLF